MVKFSNLLVLQKVSELQNFNEESLKLEWKRCIKKKQMKKKQLMHVR